MRLSGPSSALGRGPPGPEAPGVAALRRSPRARGVPQLSREVGGLPASTSRAPTAEGAEAPPGTRVPSRPATSPSRPAPPREASERPSADSEAAASPASPEAPTRPFLPGPGPKLRAGGGGEHPTVKSFPARSSRGASLVALRTRGCHLSQCFAGVSARLGLLAVSRLLKSSPSLCTRVSAPSRWRKGPRLHPKVTLCYPGERDTRPWCLTSGQELQVSVHQRNSAASRTVNFQ